MRNAVSLAEGFWYQHSFISLAMEVRVWGEEKSVNVRVNAAVKGCVNGTYWVRKPSVWYVWPLLVHTHNLLHVLKTGITGDHVVERRLVVFHDTCRAQIMPNGTCQFFPLAYEGKPVVAISLYRSYRTASAVIYLQR